jgi:ADP-ribosyl-[dinitrogen reductase] hydrolase
MGMVSTHASAILYGMACGDALGATLEFKSPERIAALYGRLDQMIGGGWLNLQPGETTDDTQMAMCLVRALETSPYGGYSSYAALSEYIAWAQSGPADIGATISQVLGRCMAGESPDHATWSQHTYSGGRSAGNGSLMRCWPLAIAYADNPVYQAAALRADSLLTHHDPLAADACVFAGRLLVLLSEATELEAAFTLAATGLDQRIYAATQISPEAAAQSAMSAMGFVLTALGIACVALRFSDPIEGLLWAVNLGGDADTNGAIAGALLGARQPTWPAAWCSVIDVRHQIDAAADWLIATQFAAPLDTRDAPFHDMLTGL